MGIYIEGMEVPKDGMLEFVITDKGTVILTSRSIRVDGNEYFEPLLTPQELYRAVPVPAHGRLIDANALYEDCILDRDDETMATATRFNEYMQFKIFGAPTIIEAEVKRNEH